jgi:hypothetical protein
MKLPRDIAQRLDGVKIVYELIDPMTGQTRYVGASRTPVRRAYAHWRGCVNGAVKWWLDGLEAEGLSPNYRLHKIGPGESWREAEQRVTRIAWERGDPLLNIYNTPRSFASHEERVAFHQGRHCGV